ncbi:MAG: hypothetical protein QOI39_1071 [Mycobacterium sp.]|nr:hypothetical protein [Mycobacterium sp.]
MTISAGCKPTGCYSPSAISAGSTWLSPNTGSAFRNCMFNLTTLWHSTFRHYSMLGSVFVRCLLRPVTLDEVDFTLAGLGGNDLRGVDLSGCRMREANLVETNLRRTLLCGADLTGARTTGTRMEDADLRGATVDSSVWTTASLGGRASISPKRWRMRRHTDSV